MTTYNVYMHNVPKVGDDGKPVPIAPPSSKEFSELSEAQSFAAENKDEFERVTIMRLTEDAKRLMERYIDGEHSVNDKPEPTEEKAEEAGAAEDAGGGEGETVTEN